MNSRAWYRLHVSTWLLTLCAVPVLVSLNIFGSYRVQGWDANSCDHGWPCVYLHRYTESVNGCYTVLEHMNLMPWGGDTQSVHPWLLVVNVVTGGLILVGLAALLEARRRRRAYLFQFKLWEWLGLFLATGVAFGIVRQANDSHQRALRLLESQRTVAQFSMPGFSTPPQSYYASSISSQWEPKVPGGLVLLHEWWYPPEAPAQGELYDFLSDFHVLHRLVSIEYRGLWPNTEASIDWLHDTETISQLRLLWLTSGELTERDLEAIARLKQLEELSLTVHQMSPEGLKHLAELQQLRVLALPSVLHGSDLSFLTQLPNLEELEFIELAPEPTRDWSDLRLVDFSQPIWLFESVNWSPIRPSFQANISLGMSAPLDWSKEAWANLASLTGLRRLDFSSTGIATSELVRLRPLTNLAELDLSFTDVGLGTGEALAPLRNLEVLDLSHTEIGDEDIAALVRLPRLDGIDWESSNVTEESEDLRFERWPHKGGGFY